MRDIGRSGAKPHRRCACDLRLPQHLPARVTKPPEFEMIRVLAQYQHVVCPANDPEASCPSDSNAGIVVGSHKAARDKDRPGVPRCLKRQAVLSDRPSRSSANRPLPAGIEAWPVEVIREGKLLRFDVCRSSAWPGTAVNDGPSIEPSNTVEHRFSPEIDRSRGRICVIEEIVFTGCSFNSSSMSRALPVGIRSNDWICGILRPWTEQMLGTSNSFGVAASSSAACVAGIEKIKVPVTSHDVWSFDDSALPCLGIVDDELCRSSGYVNQIVSKRLGPDGCRSSNRVAILLPDEKGMALFIACHRRIDRSIRLADQRAMIGIRPFRLVGRRHGNTQRTASLAPHVIHQDVTAIVHQLRRPEAA